MTVAPIGIQRRMRRIHAGLYRSDDGRYEISYEEWFLDNECGCVICQNGAPNCPNGGYGKRSGWTLWDTVQKRHAFDDPFGFDTYREARSYYDEGMPT